MTESSSNPAAESKRRQDLMTSTLRDIEQKRDQNVLPFEPQSDEEDETSCAA
jgi:hypothetical protein